MAQSARLAPQPAAADEIVVLRSTWPRATLGKRFSADVHGRPAAAGYRTGRFFVPQAIPVGDIRGLHAAWSSLADEDGAMVARAALSGRFVPAGTPVGGGGHKLAGGHITRRVAESPDGLPPGLRDAVRHWLLLDIDRTPNPRRLDPREDPDGALDWIISLLPRAIGRATASWNWSSSNCVGTSAGVAPAALSLHLRIWSDRPLAHAEAKRLVERVDRYARSRLRADGAEEVGRVIDPKAAEPQQPLYTARPSFADGIPDPFPGNRRRGLRPGKAEAVEFAALEAELDRAEAAQGFDVAAPPRRKASAKSASAATDRAPMSSSPASARDPSAGAEVVPLGAKRRLAEARLADRKGSLEARLLADRGLFAARAPLEVVRLVRGRVAAGATDPR